VVIASKYAGADWVKQSLKCQNMSSFGEQVADLLGDLFLGIYHMPTSKLRNVDWHDDACIRVLIDRNMATYDGDLLTRLVVLSHDRMIRVSIDSCNFHNVELMFHKRLVREGGSIFERMPTMESHIEMIRSGYAFKPL